MKRVSSYHPIECRCGCKMQVPREREGQIVFCGSCSRDLFIPKARPTSGKRTRRILHCTICKRIWYGTPGMEKKRIPCPLCEIPLKRKERSIVKPGGTTFAIARNLLQN